MRIDKRLRAVALFLILASVLCGCQGSSVPNEVKTPDDLSGKIIGVVADTAAESFAVNLRNVTVRRYQSGQDMMDELGKGHIDAALSDSSDTDGLLRLGSAKRLSQPLYEGEFNIAVSQENGTLLRNLNSVLSELRKAGKLAKISEDADIETPGENALSIALCPDMKPYAYYDDEGVLRGTEVTLALMICEKLGVRAEFRTVEADKLVYMVESGKVSFAVGRIVKGGSELVNYSDGYGSVRIDIIVRK